MYSYSECGPSPRRGLPVLILVAAALAALAAAVINMLACAENGDAALPAGICHSLSAPALSRSDLIPEESPASASDASVSSADTVPSDVVVYYPEVHIDGIVLPEEFGSGLFDPNAAMWLINEYRRQNGLHQLLIGDFHLSLATNLRLDECQVKFSHERPDGSQFSSAYREVGILYRFCAENLAFGQYTAEEVVLDWIQSPTHRDNLLSPNVTFMCVKTALGEDGYPRWVFEAYSVQ